MKGDNKKLSEIPTGLLKFLAHLNLPSVKDFLRVISCFLLHYSSLLRVCSATEAGSDDHPAEPCYLQMHDVLFRFKIDQLFLVLLVVLYKKKNMQLFL